jgi:phosphate transport system ATP-binding protein
VNVRRTIGMVFQQPNPFPTMTVYDNVAAGYALAGTRKSKNDLDGIVESCLKRTNLWDEVKDRLNGPGASLSGGQQQRLCIARAIAIEPTLGSPWDAVQVATQTWTATHRTTPDGAVPPRSHRA